MMCRLSLSVLAGAAHMALGERHGFEQVEIDPLDVAVPDGMDTRPPFPVMVEQADPESIAPIVECDPAVDHVDVIAIAVADWNAVRSPKPGQRRMAKLDASENVTGVIAEESAIGQSPLPGFSVDMRSVHSGGRSDRADRSRTTPLQ
ncbi:MAG: hypothetical protein R3D57_12015 [Hyphomicrobiaceae bacterium]